MWRRRIDPEVGQELRQSQERAAQEPLWGRGLEKVHSALSSASSCHDDLQEIEERRAEPRQGDARGARDSSRFGHAHLNKAEDKLKELRDVVESERKRRG